MSGRPVSVVVAVALLLLAVAAVFFGLYLPGHLPLQAPVPALPVPSPPPLPPHVALSHFVADWSVIISGALLCGRSFGFGVAAAWLMSRHCYRLLFCLMFALLVGVCRRSETVEDGEQSASLAANVRARISAWLVAVGQWLMDDN